MNRRRYIALLTAGGVGGLAGCQDAGLSTTEPSSDEEVSRTATATQSSNLPAPGEEELPISRNKLTRGAPKDGISAIVEPAFADDWRKMPAGLDGSERVIGIKRNDKARAYPLAVLNWHEVVNDTFGGPLLVTYCPLCGSGVTGVRTVDGEASQFGVSGLLWHSDLVMYDAKTDSLWSQILAQAINGPKTGTKIEFVPSAMTTWSEWHRTNPDTQVLLPPPESRVVGGDAEPVGSEVRRDYDTNPYEQYEENESVGIGQNEFADGRLHPKALVIGVTSDGVARAYPLKQVRKASAVNDRVGDLAVVVTVDAGGSLSAYERRVDRTVLTFTADDKRHIRAGGSRWERNTGEAIDGPYKGTVLTRANDLSPMFWFAWADFRRNTEIYRQ